MMTRFLNTAKCTLLSLVCVTACYTHASETQQCANPNLNHREYGVTFTVDCKAAGYNLRYTGELPKGLGPNILRYDLAVAKSGLILKELSGKTYLEAPIQLGLAITHEAIVLGDGTLKLKSCTQPGCEVFKKIALEQAAPVEQSTGTIKPGSSAFIIPAPGPLDNNSQRKSKDIQAAEPASKAGGLDKIKPGAPGTQATNQQPAVPQPEVVEYALAVEGLTPPAPTTPVAKAPPKNKNIFQSLKELLIKPAAPEPTKAVQVIDLISYPGAPSVADQPAQPTTKVVVTPVRMTSFSVLNPEGSPSTETTPTDIPSAVAPTPERQPEPEVDDRLKRARERAARLNGVQ